MTDLQVKTHKIVYISFSVGEQGAENKPMNWLVPQTDVQENEVRKKFDPDEINSSVVMSPLRPIKVSWRKI